MDYPPTAEALLREAASPTIPVPPAPAQPSKTFAQAVQDSETLTPAASAAASPVTPAAQAVKVTVETPALVSAPASPTASSFLAATVPSSPAVVAVAPAVAATPQQHTTPTLTHARPIQWAHDSRRILLVGEAGVGKTTLAAALLGSLDPSTAASFSTPRSTLDPEEDPAKAWGAWAANPGAWEARKTVRDLDSRVIISLAVQDTPGWDPTALPPTGGQGVVASTLNSLVRGAYTATLASDLGEGGPPSLPPPPPSLFSAALLLLPPHRPPTAGERALMAALSAGPAGVPVIPILAKADAYTNAELVGARAAVAGALLAGKAGTPPPFLFSEASLASAHAPRGAPPFAVLSGSWSGSPSGTVESIRAYAWGGAASAVDPAASDLAALASLLIDAPDLPSAARARYAAFRAAALGAGGKSKAQQKEAAAVVREIEAAEGEGGGGGGRVPLAATTRAGGVREWLKLGVAAVVAAALGAAIASPTSHARAKTAFNRAKASLRRTRAKGDAARHDAAAHVAETTEAAAGSFLDRLASAKDRAAALKVQERNLAAQAREEFEEKKVKPRHLFW